MGRSTKISRNKYQGDGGKWFEDTTETVTITEDGNSTVTTTKTTREIDPFSMDEFAEAFDNSTRTGSKKEKEKKGIISRLADGFGSDSDSDEEDEEKFSKKVLKLINQKRKLHKVKNLKISKDLMKSSKKWGKHLAKSDTLKGNPDKDIGENIHCVSSNVMNFPLPADKVVEEWYKEIEMHDFSKEPEGGILKTSNFSNMIWKDTKEMGVYKARSKDGLKAYVVAHFSPKGLYIGQFVDQIPKVGGKSGKIEKKKTVDSSSSSSSSSSDSDSSSSSDDEDDFAKESLDSHNDYRKRHGAKSLKYSKKLENVAQDWADEIAKKDVMQHRPNNKYGENIFMAYSSNPNHKIKGSQPVGSWYDEIKYYSGYYGREPPRNPANAIGHFTQVVWADTKEVGVGMAKSKSGKIYVVANYDPPGNMIGSYSVKVPALK